MLRLDIDVPAQHLRAVGDDADYLRDLTLVLASNDLHGEHRSLDDARRRTVITHKQQSQKKTFTQEPEQGRKPQSSQLRILHESTA